jgi:hypothetical protein
MVEYQIIYSPERKKHWSRKEYYESLFLNYSIISDNNILTLLAAVAPSSRPEWVLLCLFSCFPLLCWVPTDSFYESWAGLAPFPSFPADRFQELWIQATALFPVSHRNSMLLVLTIVFRKYLYT